MSKQVEFAQKIATAVFTKLQLHAQYDVVVRRHAEPAAMPWIEVAFTKKGKTPEDGEHCISMPESQYDVPDKEAANKIATYVYKTTAMMLGKLAPKG